MSSYIVSCSFSWSSGSGLLEEIYLTIDLSF